MRGIPDLEAYLASADGVPDRERYSNRDAYRARDPADNRGTPDRCPKGTLGGFAGSACAFGSG